MKKRIEENETYKLKSDEEELKYWKRELITTKNNIHITEEERKKCIEIITKEIEELTTLLNNK